MSCGRLTRGSDPNDDLLPCGTKLYLGTDKRDRTEAVLLCQKCKESQEQK